ncbi:hypothetical protein Z968_08965 [Clostridium novyi A str. 4552]|uniref:DHHW protein n=1 Tax=Clostridium novyi A str. 4552 TaxID=1444289 RepID=A0A0A0I770_CLONO|nr:DHHW family protein [Clostridium novyi]KGM95525.1 hypothetical protein Z968_08965 [Clostridium novyi A str. 4552]
MKLHKFFLSTLMIFFIIGMFVVNLFSKDKTFSEAENRVLQNKPTYSFEKLKSGKFTQEYEKYITDQFAFRNFWVGVKSSSDKLLGKKDNNGVYLGSNGYLLEKPAKVDNDLLEDNIESINEFAKRNYNCKVNFLLAPNSVNILKNKLPKYATPEDEKKIIDNVKENLDPKNVKFVDVYDDLNMHNKEYIYYKTDHHWTTLGAYYAYKNLGNVLNYKPLELNDFNIEKVTDNFYGTLYSKGNYREIKPDFIQIFKPKKEIKYKVKYFDNKKSTDNLYEMENLNKKDKYSVFLDGNHDLVVINTNSKDENINKKQSIVKKTNKRNKKKKNIKKVKKVKYTKAKETKKLLIIKDSYAHSLVPFLTNHYDEIHMVDFRYFNDNIDEYIKNNNIKNILIMYNGLSFSREQTVSKLQTP